MKAPRNLESCEELGADTRPRPHENNYMRPGRESDVTAVTSFRDRSHSSIESPVPTSAVDNDPLDSLTRHSVRKEFP